MSDSVQQFYDELAFSYHLLFTDYHEAVLTQGKILHEFILRCVKKEVSSLHVLDCSCGIGTQAIGLALAGYRVTATDVSPVSIEKARENAKLHEVSIPFDVADFRTLNVDVSGTFDIVLSADNALPHLLSDEELQIACTQLFQKVKAGGNVLLTIRDYDAFVQEKPSATTPRVLDDGKRIVFQTWDWSETGKTYLVKQFILQEQQGEWQTTCYQTYYRALLRKELSDFLSRAGFVNIEWHFPEQSGFYQPVVIARKV